MTTIAVVGLGYVGLPLAVEFGKKYRTIGFDLSNQKVASYARFVDPTGEVSERRSEGGHAAVLFDRSGRLREADFIVVAVPTPVDDAHHPTSRRWSELEHIVGRNLKRGAIVVYRIHRLSGRDRRGLHSDPRDANRA